MSFYISTSVSRHIITCLYTRIYVYYMYVVSLALVAAQYSLYLTLNLYANVGKYLEVEESVVL